MSEPEVSKLAVFEGKQIRKTFHEGAWWFVIVDVVAVLTDSANPSGYLKDMRRRDPSLAEAFKGEGQFATPLALKFTTTGGPQNLQCWNTEVIFRLIQSIPSPKAKPFKRWLARIGEEPPLKEQAAIADYIDAKEHAYHLIRSTIEAQIATLTAYRKSLIHECVTGQLRITEADAGRKKGGVQDVHTLVLSLAMTGGTQRGGIHHE